MRYFFIVGLLFSFSKTAYALQTKNYYGTRTVTVTVPYIYSSDGLVAESITFAFPKPVFATDNHSKFMIVPESTESPDHSRLAITPMVKSGEQKVVFTLTDGQVVKVRIKIVRKKNASTEGFRFRPGHVPKAKRSKAIKGSDIDVMMVLLSAKDDEVNLSGFEESRIHRRIDCGYWGLQATMTRVYTSPNTKAYIIKMWNRSRKYEYSINLGKLFFKGQDLNRSVLSHSTSHRLVPKKHGNSTATIKIVGGSSVHINNLHLCDKDEQATQKVYVANKGAK